MINLTCHNFLNCSTNCLGVGAAKLVLLMGRHSKPKDKEALWFMILILRFVEIILWLENYLKGHTCVHACKYDNTISLYFILTLEA
jgi:hypothetical protein